MKKALVISLLMVIGLGVAVFAGSFVGLDFTIPDDGTLYFGVKDGPLTLELSLGDLFYVPPTLSFSAKYLAQFAYWDSEYQCWIEEIDFISAYPIPTTEGIGCSWCGTLYLGVLLSEPVEETLPLKFDIYGKVALEYQKSNYQLIPTGSLGFYWEPW